MCRIQKIHSPNGTRLPKFAVNKRGDKLLERSFHDEIEALKLGDGQTFHGEGILAVTKALLQSGVTYVGGYQGSPI